MMRRKVLGAMVAIASSVTVAWSQTGNNGDGGPKLVGAWEMVSYDYGENGRLPKGSKEIKLISAKHIAWVLYSVDKGETLATGGGTYSLSNDSYTEHLDYANKGNLTLVGKDQRFTVTLNGDTMQIVGTLSSGEKISETWKRID